jgi:hypothetical protein
MILTRLIYTNITTNIDLTRIHEIATNIEYKYIPHNLKIYDISIYKEILRSIIINKLINIFVNHINKFRGKIKNINKIFKYNKLEETCQKWCWLQYNNPTIKDSIIPYVENENYDFDEFIENFNYILNENITLNHPIIKELILNIKQFLKKNFINFKESQDINLNLEKNIDNDNVILKCTYNNKDYKISIHNNVYTRLINKLKINSTIDDKYIFCLVFRYSYIDAENQQLAIHKKIKELFKNFNVDFELFGSAINVLSSYYCSLFYDIEKYFGSQGSFFDIELISGIYWCNPPYINSIMTNVAHKIIDLINSKKNIAFILTIPVWDEYTKNLKINDITRNLNKNTCSEIHKDYPIYSLLKLYIKDELFIPQKSIPYFNYRHYKPIYARDTYMIIVYNNISNTNLHTVFSKIIELNKNNYFNLHN